MHRSFKRCSTGSRKRIRKFERTWLWKPWPIHQWFTNLWILPLENGEIPKPFSVILEDILKSNANGNSNTEPAKLPNTNFLSMLVHTIITSTILLQYLVYAFKWAYTLSFMCTNMETYRLWKTWMEENSEVVKKRSNIIWQRGALWVCVLALRLRLLLGLGLLFRPRLGWTTSWLWGT